MAFHKIEAKKKSHLATEALLAEINKHFGPGDKLPPERVMANELGVSRNTLREAIAALQILGVLEVRHSQGNFVINLNRTENWRSSLESIFSSNDDPFLAIDTRIAFEPGVASLAAHCASKEGLQKVEMQVARLMRAVKENDLSSYSQADFEFHVSIAECTGNPVIIQTIRLITSSLTQPLWRSMKMALAEEREIKAARLAEHKQIYLALLSGNRKEAEEAVRRHLEHSRDRLLIEFENGGAGPSLP